MPKVGAVVDPRDGTVRAGVSSELLQQVAREGGELNTSEQMAKERVVKRFRQLKAKQGAKKARAIFAAEADDKARAKRQRRNGSTKRGYGARTKNEFKAAHGRTKSKRYGQK